MCNFSRRGSYSSSIFKTNVHQVAQMLKIIIHTSPGCRLGWARPGLPVSMSACLICSIGLNRFEESNNKEQIVPERILVEVTRMMRGSDIFLQEAGPSRLSFARGWFLWMMICKTLAKSWQEAGHSELLFVRGPPDYKTTTTTTRVTGGGGVSPGWPGVTGQKEEKKEKEEENEKKENCRGRDGTASRAL